MGIDNHNTINLIFMGHLHYPHGTAGTKRIQNSIDYLKKSGDFDIKVLVLRQGRVRLTQSPLAGEYKGIEYVTIGNDIKANILAIPKGIKYFCQGIAYLKKHYKRTWKNIVYVYGYPSTENILFLLFGKLFGYKFIFDIVEDITHQGSASDVFAKLKNLSARLLFKRITCFADAVLVISKRLFEKTEKLSKNKFPIAMHPVSVNFENFPSPAADFHDPVRLFYGGTFGEKDGVEDLISAFNIACEKHDNLVLNLTGKGNAKRMSKIKLLMDNSRHKDKIIYHGYLRENEYYNVLTGCDILCVTRTASPFAQAGFPFKLGEYLATGASVIASDVSDIRDYLKNKENAIIVKPDSAGDIAEAIDFLISNPDSAKQIGITARVTAKENFDAEILGENLRQILVKMQAS